LKAWSAFGFPAIPDSVLPTIPSHFSTPWQLNVTITDHNFMKIEVLVPNSTQDQIDNICSSLMYDPDKIRAFAHTVDKNLPDFVQYQLLSEGFGFGVYKEGFSVSFVYNIK